MAAPTSVVESSTAIETGAAVRTFYQNGSAMYAAASSPLSIGMNLGGYSPTAILATSLVITAGMGAGRTPMLNVTQGTSYLANATVPYSFAVSPISPSATNVKIVAVAAFTSTGSMPSIGTYGLWFNWTLRVTFENTSLPVWLLQNGSFENLSLPLRVPTGFTLSATSLTIPYVPDALPNVTTLNVTTAATYRWHGPFVNLTTYAISPGAGYLSAYLPSEVANLTLRIRYTIVGLSTGPIPLLLMVPPTRLASGYYEATASWVNTGALPYAGAFYIVTNQSLAYSIEAGSLNVTYNYPGHYLKNSTFTLAGNQVVVLAGSLTVYGGRVVTFTLKFLLVGVPIAVGLCATCPVGSSSVPWWVLSLGAEIVLVLTMAAVYVSNRNVLVIAHGSAKRSEAARGTFWVAAVLALFVGFLTFLAFLPGL